jgi:hypothetical protein
MLNKELLKILVCPACKSPVKEVKQTLICTNTECRRSYAVRDNIPVMLVDEAEVLNEADHKNAVHS